MRRLPKGTEIFDGVNRVGYRLEAHLGQGGFGTAYRAVELTANGRLRRGSESCIKLSPHAELWHGEVYFANLLRDVGHVVQMKSAFPTEIVYAGQRRTAFAINMEWVQAGTIRDECLRDGTGWTEDQVRRRVRLLLRPLGLLHQMGVSHRDVTPPNVFLGERKVLKLGDFGISKAQLKPSGVHADLLNPDFAPPDLGTWWRPADDIYQVGLLMATLLAGEEVTAGLRRPQVNHLAGRGALRDTIKAAVSARSRRPQSAAELARLLA